MFEEVEQQVVEKVKVVMKEVEDIIYELCIIKEEYKFFKDYELINVKKWLEGVMFVFEKFKKLEKLKM